MNRLIPAGEVRLLRSGDVKKSVWGVGLEKLDRGLYDPANAYDFIGESGVKFVRIQSGWARCEKKPGVYDFAWLDDIVDNLLSRGLQPWLCLCYGNGLYDPEAAKYLGGAGCPPRTAEQLAAWGKYVDAVVSRYKGRISYYEVWNEPDGIWCWKSGVNAKEYGKLLKTTAKVIWHNDPAAQIIGGAICRFDMQWLHELFETGAARAMDLLSYHGYNPDERVTVRIMRAIKAMALQYNPELRFVQGENGFQSALTSAGALYGANWTQKKQAKALARMLLLHMISGVEICSYFSALDMCEALHGKLGDEKSYQDYATFGVLAEKFDESGKATGVYEPKESYRTLRVLASVFQGDFQLQDLPVIIDPHFLNGFPQQEPSWYIRRFDDPASDLITQGFVRPDKGSAFVYWSPKELLTTDYASTLTVECSTDKVPQLVDLVSGKIYDFPEDMVEKDRHFVRLKHIPVKDSPLLLKFGDF